MVKNIKKVNFSVDSNGQKMIECEKERKKVKGLFAILGRISAALTICVWAGDLSAAQAPNPRAVAHSDGRTDARTVSRRAENSGVVSRTAANRGVVGNVRGGTTARTAVAPARGTVSRAAVPQNRANVTVVRSATPVAVSRSAVTKTNTGRSGRVNITKSGLGRAARATAVFSDISKIGGGYAQCREAYATCMDQFCAAANDTYRRCFCSERFTEFRDTELALDEAKVLLQRFEDNNLNAVDKTAAEVNAMYTATVGEAAIKNDVSGAQSVLNEIGDLLSGKKKAGQKEENQSMDLSSLDFTVNIDDIWGSSNSLFDVGGGNRTNIADLEGQALYNSASKQCLELTADACTSDAVLNMSTSAYDIMITQDCNLYEKKIDTQRQAVMDTVRQAEKYLREARLEEYRAHNSADVNECIAKVKTAMLQDTACGEDYKRCLDYSGAYISQTTGEPIYSPRLFEMVNLITLDGAAGSGDVLGENPTFNDFLDTKRIFAESALDTCRDIAETAWTEFKRTALIEIAQAQDEKIEEVKNSCVETMAECYDTQSGQLATFGGDEAKYAGAMSVNAARAMCLDKVTACAMLYSDKSSKDGVQCEFDGNGKFKGTAADQRSCGLSELLAFVNTVDSVKINKGCSEALTAYAQELCAPASADTAHVYPWGCRNLTMESNDPNDKTTLKAMLEARSELYCVDGDEYLTVDPAAMIDKVVADISDELDAMFTDECEKLDAIWMAAGEESVDDGAKREEKFYSAVLATTSGSNTGQAFESGHGACVIDSVKFQCEMQAQATDGAASYNAETGQCEFTDKWYEYQCGLIGGYFADGNCYTK